MRVQEARARNSAAPKRELTPSGKRRASAEDRQKERRKKAKSWYRPSCCLSCCPRSCAPRGGRLLGAIEKMATHPHRAGFRFKERSRWAFEDPNIGKYLAVMFPDAIAASEVRGRIVFHTSTRNVTRVAVFFFFLQLRPDGIFPTKNNNDKDQSLSRKWYRVLYKCVVHFSDFWDRFLEQYAFGCPHRA